MRRTWIRVGGGAVLTGVLMGCASLKEANEAPPPAPLIHWSFDEPAGEIAVDASGHGIDGRVGALRVPSPAGRGLRFEGKPGQVVRARVPEGLRFGRGSWTFMAMLKPHRFDIDDRQNQRRIFTFGVYPEAYMVIDISGAGKPMCYFCYKDANGKTVATGGSAGPLRLPRDAWAHLALVCDREKRLIRFYINGYSLQASKIRKDFDGDYVLDGGLTLGSSWHNYIGEMDEVRIYRAALSKKRIQAEVEHMKERFPIKESPQALEAKRRDALGARFARANRFWAKGEFAAARRELAAVVAAPKAPPQFRSYAHLRLARAWLADEKRSRAAEVYRQIAAETSYPEVHRYEAAECLKELERLQQGLPARDPAASRTNVPEITAFAAEIHLAPNGDDRTGDGGAAKPFATLARARDAVRALKKKGVDGAIRVRIHPGEYPLAGTVEFTAADSGTANGPVVYQAEKPGKAVFYGGRRLRGFTPVTDPAIRARLPESVGDKVVQCDLKALGITDYGTLAMRGFGFRPSPVLELYCDGRPMIPARWPNRGFVRVRKLVDPGSYAQKRPGVIEYDGERPSRWRHAEDPWLFGYFRYLWADAAMKIGRIDPEAHTITFADPYRYGGGMSDRQGIIFYAFNLLEEIDAPGEWYLNRDTGILYFYPPTDPTGARVEISMLAEPMIAMKETAFVRLEGIVFDLGREDGLRLDDCEHCLLAGCTVRRFGGSGIRIRGGRANGVLGCDVHTLGRRGVELIGGDRKTLEPARHFVENCRIYDMGRIDRTYTPAIQLEGVGNRVAYNLMYDAPSSVMRVEGNDHLVEYNEVHSAVRESDDQGAIDVYGNPTYRGVIYRYNYFHQIGKTGTEVAVHGQAAIRFDDTISGMLVYGNVFWQCANGHFGAVQLNGGRDNIIDNNIFADCKQGVSGGWRSHNKCWQLLGSDKKPARFITSALYLSRYPALGRALESPGLNFLWRNVFYRCGPMTTGSPAYLDLLANVEFGDENPGFADPAAGDFRLRPDAKLFAEVGFRPIPVREIGLYPDRYRATWPVRTTPARLPDWRGNE